MPERRNAMKLLSEAGSQSALLIPSLPIRNIVVSLKSIFAVTAAAVCRSGRDLQPAKKSEIERDGCEDEHEHLDSWRHRYCCSRKCAVDSRFVCFVEEENSILGVLASLLLQAGYDGSRNNLQHLVPPPACRLSPNSRRQRSNICSA